MPPVPAYESANNKVLLLEVLALIVIPVLPSLLTTKFLPFELKELGLAVPIPTLPEVSIRSLYALSVWS